VGRTLPLAVFVCVLQLRRADPALYAAARLHDVGWRRRILKVRLPLLAPGLLTAAILVFVLSLGELGASLLVVPAGMATVSLRLYNLLHYGAGEPVAGLALLVLLLVAAGGGLALVLARWRAR
jgi:iron(III) transport system permease protein